VARRSASPIRGHRVGGGREAAQASLRGAREGASTTRRQGRPRAARPLCHAADLGRRSAPTARRGACSTRAPEPPDPIRRSPRPQRRPPPAIVPAGRIGEQGKVFPTDRHFEPLTPDPTAWPGPAPRPGVRRRRLRLPGKAQAGGRGRSPSRRHLAQDPPHLPRRRPGPTGGPALPRPAPGELTQGLSPLLARARTRRPRPSVFARPSPQSGDSSPPPSGGPPSLMAPQAALAGNLTPPIPAGVAHG
jgi:hypothetical protein